MTEDLILIGGGGHCRSCIDVIRAEGRYRIVGIIDTQENLGQKVSGYEVIGTDENLKVLAKKGGQFLITVGQIKSPKRRMEIYNLIKSCGGNFATVVSPFAYVSSLAKIGEGTIIMHHALVVSHATIGKNCIINSKALIEHDAQIGDDCHVSTGAIVNGTAILTGQTFLGSGSIVNHQVTIAGGCIIGSGSLVVRSIQESGTYIGNPLKKLNPL